jgi:hypothetical protein
MKLAEDAETVAEKHFFAFLTMTRERFLTGGLFVDVSHLAVILLDGSETKSW